MTDIGSARIDLCPKSVLEIHRARKERLRRIASRAVPQPAPEIKPEIEPEAQRDVIRVVNRFGRASYLSVNAIRETNERIRDVRPVSIATIQTEVAAAYRCTRADLLCRQRTVPRVRARHVAIYLSKQLTPFSLLEIGRRFGGRDHTTILSGIRKIERLRKSDPALDAELRAIAASLGGALA